MDDVELAILDAWRRLALRFARDPAELRRRLRRRQQSRGLARPPRAWCVAIRAADTRIDALRRPVGAPKLRWAEKRPHTVTLDVATIRRLCAPVTLDPPGMTLDEVADRLGVTPHGLLNARLAKVFQTRYVPGLAGQWGKPRPLLYTDQLLDPASRGFTAPDPVWSWTARYLTNRIPDDLPEQTLRRVQRWHERGPSARDTTDLHPEHPAVDPTPAELRKLKALPSPPPDYVAYKWKGDEYLAHDWKNPSARFGHARAQQRLIMSRAAAKKRRRENPPPRGASGSLEFRGWQWLCPKCSKAVNVVFMPVLRRDLLNDELGTMNDEVSHALRAESSSRSLFIVHHSSFACEHCTGLRRFSRCDPNCWNEIVTYLSGGLLYGREVLRPSWFPRARRADHMKPDELDARPGRKIAFTPRPTRAPSKRRPQIEPMLLGGVSFKQIAARLGLANGTVLWYARQIYKQHGVRTLPELLTRLGKPEVIKDSRYKTEEIRRRLRAGQPTRRIAEELAVPMHSVYNQRVKLLRAGVELHDGRNDTHARSCLGT